MIVNSILPIAALSVMLAFLATWVLSRISLSQLERMKYPVCIPRKGRKDDNSDFPYEDVPAYRVNAEI